MSIEKIKQTQYSGGDVCLSSCGKFLLCIYGSCVNVVEVETGETRLKLESEEEEVTCISLSPDNKHLITAHKNLLLKQWNNWNDFSGELTKTKCTRTWKAIHSAPIVFMCFDVTSTLLATASSDFTTKIWDIHAQYCTHNLKGAQGIVRLCKFHPLIEDIQQCVTGCEDGKLRVYDLSTSKLEACLEGHFSAITCFDFLKSNQKYDRLISGSRDKVLIIWDLTNFSKLKTIPIYESIESFLLMSHITSAENNECLITMGNEGLLKIWDLKTYKVLYKQNEIDSLKVLNKRKTKDMADLELVINQGLYNKQTNTLLIVTADQLIMFIKIDKDLIEKRLLKEFKEKDKLFVTYKQYIGDHGEILDTQMCNSNENLLALATNSEFLKIYNLNTWDCKLLKGHTDLIISLSVFNDKKDANISYIASSSKDATIRIWKIEKLNENENEYSTKCVCVCKGHTQDVGAICFSKLKI